MYVYIYMRVCVCVYTYIHTYIYTYTKTISGIPVDRNNSGTLVQYDAHRCVLHLYIAHSSCVLI